MVVVITYVLGLITNLNIPNGIIVIKQKFKIVVKAFLKSLIFTAINKRPTGIKATPTYLVRDAKIMNMPAIFIELLYPYLLKMAINRMATTLKKI